MSEQEHDELQRIGPDHLTADSSALVTDDPGPGSSRYTLPKGRLWPAPTRLHPSALVLDYTRQLVNRIEENKSKGLSKEAQSLLQVTQLSIDSEQAFAWDPFFLQAIGRVLRNHPSLATQRTETATKKLLDQLAFLEQPAAAAVPPSFYHHTMSSNFLSGMADRIAEERGLAQLVAELGPSSTRMVSTLREVLQDYTRTTKSPITEAALASLLVFLSNAPSDVVGLSSVLLGSIVPGRTQEQGMAWNLEVVAQVLAEDYGNLDWRLIAHSFDVPMFTMKDTNQFGRLLDLYRAGTKTTPPLSAFTRQWQNASGQLSALEAILSVPANVFPIPLDDEEQADAATSTATTNAPHPQCWASQEILQRILQLSEVPSLYRRVRDLFVRCLVGCPEILLCSLVRLQLRVANQTEMVNTGVNLKQELMRELIPLFFRPSRHRVGAAAIRRLYAISSSTVIVACWEAYRSTLQEGPAVRLASILHIISLARHLPNPPEAVANLLSGNQDMEYSIALAFVIADNEYLQLNAWLGEKLSKGGSVGSFAVSLVSYLQKNYAGARPKSDGAMGNAPLVSLENIVTSLKLLQALDRSILNHPVNGGGVLGEMVQSLVEHCLSTHPSLRSAIAVGSTGAQVEKLATLHFQKIYTSEQSIGEVVEMLKRFKNSGDSKENEIFACMVHNLYDEYRFFAKYPDRELRITGILFGALIQEQLVSSITLGIALRYVLEALRKPPSPPGATTSNGKMFQFGMFALEQFKGRLHEWPQYCSHIVQIPHLKEGYADLVSEIEKEMVRGKSDSSGQPPAQSSSDDVASSLPDPVLEAGSAEKQLRIADFGPKLGRAVTEISEEEKEHESPTDATLDKVQFLVNNLAMSNVEKKSTEIKDLLDPKFFGWLAQYLVVKRISTQANYHSLYLAFLDNLGEFGKGLVEAILQSVYLNIGKLLRSPKITTSSSERGYLKNLGIWLGQMTLSRNRPIKQIMLDCKELLLQGYETGKLIAVAPFLAKMLEGAKNSFIFRPPNPWLMGILGVFRSIYHIEELKMNIKFEIEVLCKNLSVKLEDIPLRDELLGSRIAPVKERNPDFNFKTSSAPGSAGGSVASAPHPDHPDQGSPEPETVIPNLSSYVTVNTTLPQLLQTQASPVLANLNIAALKRFVPMAVDRAIREIIQPVVERSVTIACITTKEIVSKDFAMESDESKMRKAGQLMVANLAGSLALVTCREPLRSSVSSHLRQLLTSSTRSENLGEQDQNVIEQCVQICATDNLELGCKLIEKAATEKAVRDVDEALGAAMSARRKHREQTGQPFFDMSIFQNENGYPAALPDQLRPEPGGLLPEHFQLYESFQRTSRHAHPPAGQGGSSAAVSSVGPPQVTGDSHDSGDSASKSRGGQFGTDTIGALASKLDAAVTALLTVAGTRAREVKLVMLPADHQICRLLAAVKDAMPNSGPNGPTRALSASEQEMVLGFSQGVFKRLYELSLSEPLRLESMVALLANINSLCPKLGKDMGTWATYAPTNTEQQRRLHRTVLLLLVRSRLLSIHDLDGFLAARSDNGRNALWVEFAIVFLRTALLENIASIVDFPKIVDLMERIVDGRTQVAPQIAQNFRKPILQILEESRNASSSNSPTPVPTRDQQPVASSSLAPAPPSANSFVDSSSLSAESLSALSGAAKKIAEETNRFVKADSESDQKQVVTLLETWIRVQADGNRNDKTLGQFLLVLQQWGVGKVPEKTERFLRVATISVVEVTLKSATKTEGSSKLTLNYGPIDMYCKLLHLIFKHLHNAGPAEQIHAQRLGMLNKILGTVVRTMLWHSNLSTPSGSTWDQRPWYRILLNVVMDFNKPDQHFEPIKLGILSVFGAAFHVCQPLVLPGFAFSWLELVSHRHFLPNLLLFPGQKAWHIAHELIIDQLLSLEPCLRRIELVEPIKKLYEGTLRVLLVLMHDVPSFMAGYHLSLCNVIPETCVQLRNIVLAASPKGLTAPDPFTPNLKIDLLPETAQAPTILSNVLGPIEKLRAHLDAYLNEAPRRNNFLTGLLPHLCLPGTREVDASKVNALVLYVGARSLARAQSPQISLSRTPGIEILEKLMEFDDRGRYVCLNAIANQLRFPSSHTHYFSCVILYLFIESKSVAVKEQVTRVLLERLIVHRPHPWGILITFIELIKNQRYAFWSYPFTRSASEIEKVFESVARSCMPPGQRTTLVGGDDQ